MKTKFLVFIAFLAFLSCNNIKTDKRNDAIYYNDSLLRVIDSLKNNNQTNSHNEFQNNSNGKKYVYVLINYINAYKYYFSLTDDDFNGKWTHHVDTVLTMTDIKEYDNYDEDLEYQLLDEVEKSLPFQTKKHVKDINIIKVISRKAKVFTSYSAASISQEEFRRQSETKKVGELKDIDVAQTDEIKLTAFAVSGFIKKDGKMLPLSDFSPNWEDYTCNYTVIFNSEEIDIIDENNIVKNFFVVEKENTNLTDTTIGQLSFYCHDRNNNQCTVTLKMDTSDPHIFAYLLLNQMTDMGLATFTYYLKKS